MLVIIILHSVWRCKKTPNNNSCIDLRDFEALFVQNFKNVKIGRGKQWSKYQCANLLRCHKHFGARFKFMRRLSTLMISDVEQITTHSFVRRAYISRTIATAQTFCGGEGEMGVIKRRITSLTFLRSAAYYIRSSMSYLTAGQSYFHV